MDEIIKHAAQSLSAGAFFMSSTQMQKERKELTWVPTRSSPSMPEGVQRCFDIPATLVDTSSSADSVGTSTNDVVLRWRAVMIPAFTVPVTGENTAFVDFNFLPNWLEHEDVANVAEAYIVRRKFKIFIVELFTRVAALETTAGQGEFMRRVDFHKLQEEAVTEQYTYFCSPLLEHVSLCKVIPIASAWKQQAPPPLRIQRHGVLQVPSSVAAIGRAITRHCSHNALANCVVIFWRSQASLLKRSAG